MLARKFKKSQFFVDFVIKYCYTGKKSYRSLHDNNSQKAKLSQ